MHKIYKNLLALLFVSTLSFSAFAQQYWRSSSASDIVSTDKAVKRQAFPKEFKVFNLDIAPLRQQLFSVVDNKSGHSTVISLPDADGKMEQFEVFEASNFDAALQRRFPEIRAFSGRGLTDKSALLKISISPQGIQTMVFRSDAETEFIEPYSQDHKAYAVFRSQRAKGALPWTCTTEDQNIYKNLGASIPQTNLTQSSAGELRTMRLAQSCTGEYSNYFGATNSSQVNLVLAAYNATLTRCNGCYEKDLATHLNLISNSTDVIYYDPASDPYSPASTGAGGAWNGELQATLTSVIGEGNYDIGHLFGATGGGGNAGCIGCVCNDGTKGRGFTSPADGIPQGDNFDIDYVVHEVGHQMGGNHTFSMSNEGTGVNKEVGSGITIMGYAGITSYDVAPHSIDIFHEASIQQIQANLANKTCPVTTNITANNATPVVTAIGPFTIPISTPFFLTGIATDANPGDVLTYCWEQNDNSTTTNANSVASPAKLTGPNWISFSPSTSPTRIFPKMATILAGLNVSGPLPGGDAIANTEALSSVGRTLNFRLTVRDNVPYSSTSPLKVGQTNYSDVVVTVDANSGPFNVTSPNTVITWNVGSTVNVTWSVNNTNIAPINCANVKITMSTDGGTTFPIILAASTPNDGSEAIVVPNNITSTARVKIEAIGNIFFDISNTNFSVAPPLNGFTFNSTTPATSSCPAPSTMAITLGTTVVGTFSTPINLTASGNPAGTTVSFGANPIAPGGAVVVTLNNTNTLANGTYTVNVQGVAGAVTQNAVLTFTVNTGSGPAITTQPATQSVCAGGNVTFSTVATGAVSYQWQVSTDGGTTYSVLPGATNSSYSINGVLISQNNYQYRCSITGQCNVSLTNWAILTVNAVPAITSQPQSVTLCAGSNNTFSVTATGGGLTYQWQLSTDNGTSWNPISGATSNTYTINAITIGLNGNQYRCVVTGSCAPVVTSNAATLGVVTSVTITTQPADVVACVGSNANFTVAGSGAGIVYQWQLSTDGGTTWTNISSSNAATYTVTGVTTANQGYKYRCLLSNATCTTPGVSNAGTLTVNTLPAIGTQPQSVTLCVGGSNTFSATATGTSLTYQWQLSTDGGTTWNNISGATTSSYAANTVTLSQNTQRYRVVVSGACTPPATSNAAVLTVIAPVSVTAQPANVELCSGSTATFNVTGSSVQTIVYQWQQSTDGGTTWTNISGATTNSYQLSTAASNSGTKYRCLLSNATCTAPTVSGVATLTVRQLPTVGLSASILTILFPGQTTTLTATPSASTGGSLSVNWYQDGNPIVNAGNTRLIDVEHTGVYQVRISESWPSLLVCSNQSPNVTILPGVSGKLFIYPTPNDGQFTVSYYNQGGTQVNRSVSVFDGNGQRVFYKTFTVSGPYTLIPVDVRKGLSGMYVVVIGDANGKKLTERKIIVNN